MPETPSEPILIASDRALAAILYAAVLGLLAMPLAVVVVPPLVDYPNHLARMHILATYADSAALRANYVVAWKLSPYLAMDVIVPVMARVVSIYTAGRIFVFLCLALLVLGTVAVHASLHRRFSAWPAVSGLFAYSYAVSYGFVNYVFGVGVWLLAFAGWILLSRGPVRWRMSGGLVLSLSVYFAHYFAFFGYMLCVGAYEFGVWFDGRDRRLPALIRRGVIAFCPFVPPLVLFLVVSRGQDSGATWYPSWYAWFLALLSPLFFLGGPFNFAFLSVALVIPFRRGLLGRIRVHRAMWAPLAALGLAALAMPNTLLGVWGVDYRLPIAFLLLLIGGSAWCDVPVRAARGLSVALLVVLALNLGLIVRVWLPVGQQFDEFRAALRVIPKGAKVIAFRDDDRVDPYTHLPLLAVIERDAYVPYLFKNPMLPVEAAPALRVIDATVGEPIHVEDMIEGADPVKGPAMLGRPGIVGYPGKAGMRNYWGDWPHHFDDAIELRFGPPMAVPGQLKPMAEGDVFRIFSVQK